ncbi:KIF-binding protein-like [Temnothorax longispinosus]|uniref:KIF-binding protein-like n=1 Tax=Temnothorax longispinosus TaxID=300112 RepID=UPI003A9A0B45
MFAFLRQVMEERQDQILQLETIPAESTTNMNISKKFLDILQLSFEIKYMDEDIKLAKKKNKIKALEERMSVLYHNIIDLLKDQNFDDIVALATAYYNIGLEYVTSTDIDDLKTALHCLSSCLELLKDKMLDRKAILIYIGTLNELNSVCEKLGEEQNTKCLNKALALYYNSVLRNKGNYPDLIHIASVIGIKEKESNPRIILNTLHHTTLQELGRQYLKKSKDKHAFVKYIHDILNIRLIDMVSDKTKFDDKCLDMAVTLFDLSKYFLANSRFAEAKSHIAIGDYVIYRFVEDLSEEKKASLHLNVRHNYALAVSAKSWGFYGVSLLRFWMEKFSQNKEKFSEVQDRISKLEIKSEDSDLIFSDLLEKELEHIAIKITETCILNLADAKLVFLNTLRELETAKKYFTADIDIESYAKITLKISDTYKYLAGFEEQRDKQIKLHKRRVESLENARKKFHTITVQDRELQIYKRIWYEVVTSCSTVMDLMIEETYYDESFKEMSMKADQYAKMIGENIDFYLNAV